MRKLVFLVTIVAVLAMAASVASAASTVNYTGQGLRADGFGGYDLNKEICGVENGADVDGPYLLWVFTAQGGSNVTITGPWGTAAMTQSGGGTFKYVSGWYDPATLPGNVTASYDGKVKNAQLVVSHGCRPFNQEKPTWCSPGFWKTATTAPGTKPNGSTYPGAWPLTGHTPSDLFNSTVVPSFYNTAYSTFKIGNGPSATFITDPTLQQVLDNPGGVNSTVSGPLGLDQFNATGAMLTDALDGFSFSSTDQAAGSDTCPIDSFGNLKVPV
jgi:hypothetical protein